MTLTSCKHNYLRGIYSVRTENAAHFYVRGCAGPAGLACGRLCCEYLSDAIKMKHVFELGPANHYDYIYTPNDYKQKYPLIYYDIILSLLMVQI